MRVYTLDIEDDEGGLSIGVFTSKIRALAALRHAVGRERFAAFEREDSEGNPDWHAFHDDDGTRYRIAAFEVDRHV